MSGGQYVQVPGDASLNGSIGAFALWLKVASAVTNASIFCKSDSNSRNGMTTFLSGGLFSFNLYNGSGTVTNPGNGGVNLNDGAWHHVVFNYNQANGGQQSLVIDGTNVSTVTNTGAWNWNGSQVTRLGRSTDGFWGSFNGAFAEYCQYNVQLTDDECRGLMRHGPWRVRPSGLLVYLPLNEG
jgi:hypothetical protein